MCHTKQDYCFEIFYEDNAKPQGLMTLEVMEIKIKSWNPPKKK